jgi:NAD+ synthase (glutamine-hydrolysing)
MRICLAQINSTVGDFQGNLYKITDAIATARARGASLIAFPELALTGYPPEDLLLNESFVRTSKRFIRKVAAHAKGISVICGYVGSKGKAVFNSAIVAEAGEIKLTYSKVALPNYGVFDEKRYFTTGSEIPLLRIGSALAGLNICEDIWVCPGITERQAGFGARLIINISASPYHMHRVDERIDLLRSRARNNRCHVVYVNLVGGQDELIFDGASLAVGPNGKVIAAAKAFAEDMLFVDLPIEPVADSVSFDLLQRTSGKLDDRFAVRYLELAAKQKSGRRAPIKPRKRTSLPVEEEAFSALVLGTRDYIKKNGFEKTVVGLSGGIDSALTLAVAVEALGPDDVHSIFMPSRYTSQLSARAAKHQADLLNCKMETVEIDPIYESYIRQLDPTYPGIDSGTTSENLQARIRGNILMAYSNRTGAIVLNTSNKSEAAVGYTTLYGDMVGGFAVLKDIPKTLVFDISRYLNKTRKREVIAREIIKRVPTAELKANQADSDSLPPYEILDEILRLFVELDTNESEIVRHGFDRKTVRKVIRMVRASEYKRRQSPPGIKVTPRAFGRDRRWPITNKF